MTAPTPDLVKIQKKAEGGWFATAAETLHVLDALAAVTAERDQARQMLEDAPHERDSCRLFDSIGHRSVQLPESACSCWKATL